PELYAGFPFMTRRDAGVIVAVEITALDDGRADVHRADLGLESILGDVPHAAELAHHTAVDHVAVGNDGGGVAVRAADCRRPQLLAGPGVVALELEGNAEDELILIADAGDDGGAPGAEELAAAQARIAAGFRRFPDLGAGSLVDGNEKLARSRAGPVNAQ